MKCGVHIFTGSFGSSGSPVHLRTRNNLYCVKCGVHVFSGSSGSGSKNEVLPTAEPNEPARLVHG